MRAKQSLQFRVMAAGMGLAVLLQTSASAQEPATTPDRNQTETAASPQSNTGTAQPTGADFPDSPGAVQSRLSQAPAMTSAVPADHQSSAAEPTSGQQPEPANDATQEVPPTTAQPGDPVPGQAAPAASVRGADAAQSSPQSPPQEQSPHEALGTAAAETVPTTGIAASRPAGAAVAPAKQRRVRSILIKVGALVGVGVAVGTTLALSQGSPSKPPGSN